MNSFLTLETGTVLRKRYTVKKILDQNDFEIRYLAWDQVLCAEVEIKEYFPMELYLYSFVIFFLFLFPFYFGKSDLCADATETNV